MTPKDLQSQIALGEDSKRQFKVDVRNAESLAAEMAAFANSDGRKIFIGVADNGSTPGLGPKEASRSNQLISNAASQLVRSPLTSNNLTVEKIRTGNTNSRNHLRHPICAALQKLSTLDSVRIIKGKA